MVYEGGAFGNSKRKNEENKVRIGKSHVAGDLEELERQGGMIRQQLLEKLHRALIGGANFDGFDQAQSRASQVTLATERNGQILVSSRSQRIQFDSATAVALSLGVKL